MSQPVPTHSGGQEAIVNNIVQIFGLALALIGCTVLFVMSRRLTDPRLVVGLGLYGVGLLAMLGLSTIYHLKVGGPNRDIYKCLDHIAIFIMIAGSYSPITLGVVVGPWGLVLFVTIWLVAIYGILIRVFRPHRFKRQHLSLYLGLGWLLVPTLPWLSATMPAEGVILITAGGVVYTLGVPFHNLDRLRYHTAIWHSFVVVAACLQYAAILRDVVLTRG